MNTIKVCALVPIFFGNVDIPWIFFTSGCFYGIYIYLCGLEWLCRCVRVLLPNAKHTGGSREGNENQNPLKLLHLPVNAHREIWKWIQIFVFQMHGITWSRGSLLGDAPIKTPNRFKYRKHSNEPGCVIFMIYFTARFFNTHSFILEFEFNLPICPAIVLTSTRLHRNPNERQLCWNPGHNKMNPNDFM